MTDETAPETKEVAEPVKEETVTEAAPEKKTPKAKEKMSALDEAKLTLSEIGKARDEIREERKKIERAASEMLINGRSFAGQAPQPETADDKWKREAKARYAGTGMDPT